MTLWTPRSIVGFAQDAGWHGDALRDAVQHAWAASGGNDAKVYGSGLPGGPRFVGLWQVPTSGDERGYPLAHLLDPAANAEAAHTFWVARGHYAWAPQVSPRVARDAAHIAELACNAGRGVTVIGGDQSTAVHVPAAPPPTLGAAGMRHGFERVATAIRQRQRRG